VTDKKSKERRKLSEVGVYTVEDGKTVRGEFLPRVGSTLDADAARRNWPDGLQLPITGMHVRGQPLVGDNLPAQGGECIAFFFCKRGA